MDCQDHTENTGPAYQSTKVRLNETPHTISIGCALIGTILEYFDHFIYTYFFLVFLPLFFPTDNPYHAAIVRALAISVGFIFRPLGSVFFARMADIWGRRITLIVTSFITGCATLAIGLLPTYDQIGTIASIAFIALRVIQVLAISGETTTAIFFLYEHAPINRKAFYTGLLNVAGLISAILASAVCILSLKFPHEYAWRIPFVLAGIASLLGYHIRHSVRESPLFERMKSEPVAVWSTMRQHSENVVPHLFSGILVLSVAYTITVYLSDFYKRIGFSDSEILVRNAYVYTSSIIVLLVASRLGDRFGSRNVVRLGALILFIGAIPCLSLLDDSCTESTLLGVQLFLATSWSIIASSVAASTIAIWPSRVCLQIGALIWGIAGFLSAGGMPLLMVCAYEISSSRFLGIYITCVSAIVFLTWQHLPNHVWSTLRSTSAEEVHA